jgi:hypothetical protein
MAVLIAIADTSPMHFEGLVDATKESFSAAGGNIRRSFLRTILTTTDASKREA